MNQSVNTQNINTEKKSAVTTCKTIPNTPKPIQAKRPSRKPLPVRKHLTLNQVTWISQADGELVFTQPITSKFGAASLGKMDEAVRLDYKGPNRHHVADCEVFEPIATACFFILENSIAMAVSRSGSNDPDVTLAIEFVSEKRDGVDVNIGYIVHVPKFNFLWKKGIWLEYVVNLLLTNFAESDSEPFVLSDTNRAKDLSTTELQLSVGRARPSIQTFETNGTYAARVTDFEKLVSISNLEHTGLAILAYDYPFRAELFVVNTFTDTPEYALEHTDVSAIAQTLKDRGYSRFGLGILHPAKRAFDQRYLYSFEDNDLVKVSVPLCQLHSYSENEKPVPCVLVEPMDATSPHYSSFKHTEK